MHVVKEVDNTGKVVRLVVPHCHVASVWAVKVSSVLNGFTYFFHCFRVHRVVFCADGERWHCDVF